MAAERSGKDDANMEKEKERGEGYKAKTATDSSLKEGIRRWLSEVE